MNYRKIKMENYFFKILYLIKIGISFENIFKSSKINIILFYNLIKENSDIVSIEELIYGANKYGILDEINFQKNIKNYTDSYEQMVEFAFRYNRHHYIYSTYIR